MEVPRPRHDIHRSEGEAAGVTPVARRCQASGATQKKTDPLTPAQLFERYRKKDVPPHRFLQKHLAAYLTSPVAIKTGGSPFAIADTTIDWGSIFDKYLATDGDTSV